MKKSKRRALSILTVMAALIPSAAAVYGSSCGSLTPGANCPWADTGTVNGSCANGTGTVVTYGTPGKYDQPCCDAYTTRCGMWPPSNTDTIYPLVTTFWECVNTVTGARISVCTETKPDPDKTPFPGSCCQQ